MWSGNIGNIPAGWVLCDGNNGTPDLRNKFIVGAGDTYAVDNTGGSVQHLHGFVSDLHTHTIVSGAEIATGIIFSDELSEESAIGATNNAPNLPPFHALAYIMKT